MRFTVLLALLLLLPTAGRALDSFSATGFSSHTSIPFNVVVVIIDDVGELNVNSRYGTPDVDPQFVASTPTLDAMADAGVVLENFYVHPLCIPTRAAMQTGRYPFRTDVYNLAGETNMTLSPNEVTLPDGLRLATQQSVAGRLGHFGKFGLAHHNGLTPFTRITTSPGDYYWDYVTGSIEDRVDDWDLWDRLRVTGVGGGTSVATDSGYTVEVNIDAEAEAEAWVIAQEAADPDLPWLTVLSFNAAHRPIDETPAVSGYWAGGDCDHGGAHSETNPECFTESIGLVDALIDKFQTFLETNGWSDDTLWIVFGDNGPLANFNSIGACKRNIFECGINEFAVLYGGPVLNAPRTETALASVEDIYLTVIDAMRGQRSLLPATLPDDAGHAWYNGQALHLDSVSLWEIIVDGAGIRGRDCVVSHRSNEATDDAAWAVRRRGSEYKYTRVNNPGIDSLYLLPDDDTDVLLDGIDATELAELAALKGVCLSDELAKEGRSLP